jgi:uncharacterized membrane protein YkoI
MKYQRDVVAVSAFLLFLASGTLVAQEKKLQRSDLPPAVEKTVAAQTQGATVKGFSSEIEDGKTMYEVEMTVNGHGKSLLIDAGGGVAEVEEDVPFEGLPAAVKAGLLTAAGKGKITKVESLTKQDKPVGYEAVVDRNGKKSEVSVGPSGKVMKDKEGDKGEENEKAGKKG